MENDLIVKIEIPALEEFLTPVDLMVRNILQEYPALTESEGLLDMLELAFHEAFSNICCHAYRRESNGQATIQIRVGSDQLEFLFEDTGECFAPELVPIPNLDHGPCERGLGIWLIRQIMDQYLYSSKSGCGNILRLIKHIPNLGSHRTF